MRIDGKRIVAFDFETTGFNPSYSQIIEIGFAYRNDDGEVMAHSRFCNLSHGNHISTEIENLTGINRFMLQSGYSEQQTLKMFDKALLGLGDIILLAHNADFDKRFLIERSIRYDLMLNSLENQMWCTMNMFKTVYRKRISLDDLTTCFDVFVPDRYKKHRADGDSVRCLLCFEKMYAIRNDISEQLKIAEKIKKIKEDKQRK